MLNAVAGTWMVDEGQHPHRRRVMSPKLPEHKRAIYLGRVFQDPMTGTAATMEIQENLALAKRRGKRRLLASRHHKGRSGKNMYPCLLPLGLGLEDTTDLQGRPALRRTATGAHPAYGNTEKAKASAARRAHGRSGPEDRSKGTLDLTETDRKPRSSHDNHDHPQHARCHPAR